MSKKIVAVKKAAVPTIAKSLEVGEPLGVVPSDIMSLINGVTHVGGKVIKITIKAINKTEALIDATAQTLMSQYMAYYWQHGFTGLKKAHDAVKEQAMKDFPVDKNNPDHWTVDKETGEPCLKKPSQITGVKSRLKLANRALQAMHFTEKRAIKAPPPKAKTVDSDDIAAISLQIANIKKFAGAYATPDKGVSARQLAQGEEFLAALVTIADSMAEQINPQVQKTPTGLIHKA